MPRHLNMIVAGAACCAAGLVFAQPKFELIGSSAGDMSADGRTVVAPIYDAAIQKSIVYRMVRGAGPGVSTLQEMGDSPLRCTPDVSYIAWAAKNVLNVGNLGTDTFVAQRWSQASGQEFVGPMPNANYCDSTGATFSGISSDGRYICGSGYRFGRCDRFESWRYDYLTQTIEVLPRSFYPPPRNSYARATRADGMSGDGAVIVGYDDNLFVNGTGSGRRATVWMRGATDWTQILLDPNGGTAIAVSANGLNIVGRMSSATMQATFGTTVTTPVLWHWNGTTWVPRNLGGSPGMLPLGMSADGSTVIGEQFIWREDINGGVPTNLTDYFLSLGGDFTNYTIFNPFGTGVQRISADGLKVMVYVLDNRNPCLEFFQAGIMDFSPMVACAPPVVNLDPRSQFVNAPGPYGTILNVFAAGTTPATYQWQKETEPGTWTNMSDDNCGIFNPDLFDSIGTIGSQLRLGSLSNAFYGNYRCVITNACGTATSGVATIARPCPADLDNGSGDGSPDGGVTIDDLLYYLGAYAAGNTRADLDDGSGTGTPDGGVTIDDLLYYLVRYEAGC